jgi:hypothetical protein
MRSAVVRCLTGLGWAALLLLAPLHLAAQTFPLSSADLADSAALARSMPRLAGEVLASYRDANRVRFLDHVFRLQMLTGRYREASATLAELRSAGRDVPPRTRALYAQYEVLVTARSMSERSGRPFSDTFSESFRETFARLDNGTSAWALRAMLVSPGTVASDLRWAAPDQTGKTTVPQEDALTLLHVYQAVEAYRGFAGLLAPLVAEDDARRYVIEPNIRVTTPGGATVCAIVVRPRAPVEKRPALLQFTIYADSVGSMREALLAAAHGYVGVTGHTRGKACSPDKTVPYRHDGADAAALVDWIAAQPWSDGRVGMYGGSYSGFTAWAATKHMPRALKGIMVGAPVAPGVDVPMEGNVFLNFVYPWPFYTTNTRWLDNATYSDNRRWNRLNREWFGSGSPIPRWTPTGGI